MSGSASIASARDRLPLRKVLEQNGVPVQGSACRCPLCQGPAELRSQGKYTDSFIQRVREATPFESVSDPAGKWKRSGANIVGPCPACPSSDAFNFLTKRNFFKCFSCGAGGDVFKYISLRGGGNFRDTVKDLAAKAGIREEFENPRERLYCLDSKCAAPVEGIDEIGWLAASRNLDRKSATIVWLQEAGIQQGERLAPTLRPGASRRKGNWSQVADKLTEGAETFTPESAPPEAERTVSEAESTPREAESIFPEADSAPTEAESAPQEPQSARLEPDSAATKPDSAPPEPDSAPNVPHAGAPESAAFPAPIARRVAVTDDEVKSALQWFWLRTHLKEEDTVKLWRDRGLTANTSRIAEDGLKTV